MGKIVAIFGQSGDGKTTSTIIGPNGKFNQGDKYDGMNPETHLILNLDEKPLPLPPNMWSAKIGNCITPKDFNEIRGIIEMAASAPQVKSISIDTINIYLAMKEFNDRRKMTYDQWRDAANDIIELNMLCNKTLRDDQIAYIMGHTMLQTQPDGTEKQVCSVIGKKLTKVQPEGFYSIVLFTRVEYGDGGNNKYFFQTKAQKSSAKSPIGMFDKFEIPNSMKLVDDTVRKYYGVE